MMFVEVALAAFSGAWLGVFLLAFLIVGIVAAEMNSLMMGCVTLLVGIVGLNWLFSIPILAAAIANPFMLLFYLAVYIGIGAFYTSLWCWPNYINARASRIKMSYGNWRIAQQRHEGPDDFESYLSSDAYEFPAHKNKERLANWVMMWPFELIWDLSHKPAIWLWKQVYNMLGQTFEHVGKRAARKIYNNK